MLSRWKVLTKTFPRFLLQRQKGNIGRHLWDGVDILRSFYAKDKPTVLPAIHQELGVSGNLWLAYKTFDVSFKSEEWRSFNRMDWIPYYYKISNIKIEYKNKQIPTYCVGVWFPLAWENGQHFVTPPLVSVKWRLRNDYPNLDSASYQDNHTTHVGAFGLNYSSLFDMEVLSPKVNKVDYKFPAVMDNLCW